MGTTRRPCICRYKCCEVVHILVPSMLTNAGWIQPKTNGLFSYISDPYTDMPMILEKGQRQSSKSASSIGVPRVTLRRSWIPKG